MKKIRSLICVCFLMGILAAIQIPGYQSKASNSSDFQIRSGELVKYTGRSESITLPSGIKRIGEDAFAGNTNLKKVTISEGVKEIEYGAFRDCTNLTSVRLPDSLEVIGNAAFSNTSSLKRLSLPSNLKTIGLGAFAGCSNLNTIKISSDSAYFTVSGGVLYSRNMNTLIYYPAGLAKEEFVMPSSVKTVSGYAFWGNHNLKKITLSNSLVEVSGYSFSNCKGLAEIAIPYSVRTIDAKAFENCINLERVSIPSSVGYIHVSAFDGCSKLVILADAGSRPYEYYENWKKNHSGQVLPVVLEEIPKTKEDVPEMTVGESGQEIPAEQPESSGGQVFIVGSHGQITSTAKPSVSTTVPTVQSAPTMESAGQDVPGQTVLGQTVVVGQHAVVLMDTFRPQVHTGNTISGSDNSSAGSVNKISDRAYYQRVELEEFSFPQGTASIGKLAFARSGLKRIMIPEGVREIGYGAFYHCDGLEEVSIPNTVTMIEQFAFDYTLWMENWKRNKEGGDFLIVGDQILLAYKGDASEVSIPDGVKTIAAATFLEHDEIQMITLPDSLTVIGDEAFRDCTGLIRVNGGKSLTQIGDNAFLNTAITEPIKVTP